MSTLTNRAEARTNRTRGAKSPDAYRTISEVANGLGVPQHVLRFWETRFSHIRPLKRGGGRRYYRPEDVNLLRGIRYLLYEDGYTIKGVQKVIKERGAKAVVKIGRDTIAAEAPAPAPATNSELVADGPFDADTRLQLESLLTELVDIRGELKS